MSLLDQMLIHFGLIFENPLDEACFAERYVRNNIHWSQLFLLIGGLFYYCFFIYDRLIDPLNADTTHIIRGVVIAPAFALAAALLFFEWGQRRIELVVMGIMLVGQLGLVAIYSILTLGFEYAALGFAVLYLGAAVMFQIRVKYLIIGALLMLISGIGGHLYTGNSRPGWVIINILALFAAIGFGGVSSWVRERAARRQFETDKALTEARGRIDELLYSMLPTEIVKRIQSGETAIADSHGEVSIIFADLVGFTELARRISPSQLLTILNGLFSAFDHAAERYGIDRIKTIGDAYMAIGGLQRGESARDHAENAARFAFAMLATVREMVEKTGYPINIRIGIHIGPIVSGVIGVKRPAFDCWGEAVNMASRLESQAAPGTILISESSYWRLKPDFEIAVLDEVDLKGIGLTKVYQLNSVAVSERAAA